MANAESILPGARGAAPRGMAIQALAPAKINLCLHVLGRRADGYHELSSLVAFASGHADRLVLEMGRDLALEVEGPTAAASGDADDNLVLRAARHLADGIPALSLGRFRLEKRLPVAAGLGGGSSDAATALRLLAAANGLPASDPALFEAARRTGADVPACLIGRTCFMRGIGHELDPPLALPPIPAILVNCGKPVSTAPVFKALGLAPGERTGVPGMVSAFGEMTLAELIGALSNLRNDLETPAIAVEPTIAATLRTIEALPGIRLARMSGSGATCFGLFETAGEAEEAASILARAEPRWWVVATSLGDLDAAVTTPISA